MNFILKFVNLVYFNKRNGVDLWSVFVCVDRMISVFEVYVVINVVRILKFVFIRVKYVEFY